VGRVPLPIDEHLPRIVEAVRERAGLVLVAEPGAGKTTRAPAALLDAGLAADGEIVVVQPRRLAARMAAARVAGERRGKLGGEVGYTVRFDDRSSRETRLRFVTEGILVRRLIAEPELPGVAAVVLDEFHERTLAADLSLAWTRKLAAGARPDLRVVVMSATLDADPVAAFLGCDVARVSGRAYPVEVEHLDRPDDRRLEDQVGAAVRRLAVRGLDGDVLVFLPGAGEIRRARDACAEIAEAHGLDIAALHGDLPPKEQDRAVRRGARPKIILSTNVAETSVTIEGVVAVVDSGLARVARVSPWTGLPTLEVAKISRASAAQRAGRAGRTRPGVCVRLYTRHDHDTRPAHDAPEIARADLAETVLLLRAQGEDPRAFGFFEPPPVSALDAAEALLARLGAMDEAGVASELGRQLLALPVHPRLGRVLLEAASRGELDAGATLAAVLGEREIRLSARTRFDDAQSGVAEIGPSDVLARLEAFEAVERDGLGRARARGLDQAAVHAVARTRDQLARAAARSPAPRGGSASSGPGPEEAGDEALLVAVLCGFPDRVGRRRAAGSDEIVFAGGGSGRLAPSSVVREASFVVAVEVDDRKRGATIIRAASAIEPEWLLELFPERVSDTDELRFDPKQERVERVRTLAYDGLALDESRAPAEPGADTTRALADAALAAGPARFCDPDALEHLGRRQRFAAQHDPAVPPPDDGSERRALLAMCEGATGFAELGRTLIDYLRAELGPALPHIDSLAPETVRIPGRPKGVRVTYELDRPPWIESRLQDFFGLAEGPRVAGGRVPLVLHLLAPNQRAVQVTTDLAGFWDRHYPDLRKELSRRYPRHHWPEDPRTASPRSVKAR
jgi:ATP-dependent helicase HrpB